MTAAVVLELSEYQRVLVGQQPRPTDADLRLAERLTRGGEQSARLDVRWLANGSVEVTASSWVGVVRFSCLEVVVAPKLAGGTLRVLRMFEYALGIRMLKRLPTERTLALDGLDLLDLLCLLLTEEAGALVRDGLLRDYQVTDGDLPVLRGRLRYRDQYLRRAGRVDRLECHFDDYHGDTPDNQLVAAGLSLARRRAKDADIRAAASRLGSIYAEVCEPTTVDAGWFEQRIRYDRRNARYRPAHELAKLVLRGLAFDDATTRSSVSVGAFLVDMNRVFERFVMRLVDEALAKSSALAVLPRRRFPALIRDEGTGRTYTAIEPDLIVEDRASGQRVPVDVKYKLYEARRIAVSDIYQTFLYAFTVGSAAEGRRAGIVFPAESSVLGPALSIGPTSGPRAATIATAGLDVPAALDALTGAGREALMAQVRALVEQLTGFPTSVDATVG
ncbi:McrC family protein [Geodermatophilus sabuli]|uniref:5-methylcytosine-specific restriction enzyme subunit McrC n=1 Tax=Geodermatophilus sabuli TaxID=1564158 RepID=A0A285EFL4_9ACTN|nr:hypothetical protein [Geodermatophilus sabuli]MBB3086558.1 5-methylcytosine-specific restriction enzyme subunit McrC [Geodermatophilus sabuli]SNX97790.1 5-methylcytosine-specific restriction enzyme subunit McrC [Geodermatophilus sabuli]